MNSKLIFLGEMFLKETDWQYYFINGTNDSEKCFMIRISQTLFDASAPLRYLFFYLYEDIVVIEEYDAANFKKIKTTKVTCE